MTRPGPPIRPKSRAFGGRAPRRGLAMILCLATLSGAAIPAWAGVVFLSALPDLPLMAGLTERTARGLVFDTTEGRVVETAATGLPPPEAIRRYYAESLPNLGWTPAPGRDLAFRRAHETLTLRLSAQPGGVTEVRFTLAPDPRP